MSTCDKLTVTAAEGVAPALRAVDCLANETTAAAFGRLFGGEGALMPALTILLTLYIAFFAISLLTGRSRLSISALTPRMMTLGLVLTFATSWVAYQGVVWNLAIGAPDQIAGVLTGVRGSATQIFADRMDLVFAAIAEVASTTGGGSGTEAAVQATSGSFTPGNLMWLAALLLLLGTVGVLVTARIALAVLLALGPVFVIFALFAGTRGLTAGWVRGVVLTAVTPLFVVTGGGIVMELLVPVVASLRSVEGAVDGRAALALFMVAAVHVALMSMVMKVCGTMVSGWSVFGLSGDRQDRDDARAPEAAAIHPSAAPALPLAPAAASRSLSGVAMMTVETGPAGAPSASGHTHSSRTIVNHGAAMSTTPALPPTAARRARGVGSRFQSQPRQIREMIR